VVIIGMTPPEAKYFSYQTYLLLRHYPQHPDEPTIVFNSLGDTVNLDTIETIGPDPFNRPVVLIFTPDRYTESRVRAALKGAGYPAAILNTLVIPAPMLNLGLQEDSDTLILLNRMAEFSDQAAGEAYIDNPPLRVFRITPEDLATLDPFLTPMLRIRGTGQTEMDLTHALDRLRQAILDANAGMNVTEYETRPVAYEGFDYIQRGKNSFGDTRDTLYLGAGYLPDFLLTDPMTLAEDEYLMVYGPNHVATGKVTYTNVNVYDSAILKLSLASIFSADFQGSADALIGGDPAADLMYAYTIARECGDNEPFCLELAAPENCPVALLDSSTELGVVFRNYLEPGTNLGPVFTEILYDRVIKFSPQD
jgi:hypothetical protein